MQNRLIILFLGLCISQVSAQGKGGFEQLYFAGAGNGLSMAPMAHYTTTQNWYGQARYNYDEVQTLSLYAGHTFSRNGGMTCSATPMIGGLIGKMNGGSVGMNMELGFEKLFFSSQSQYTFSMQQSSNRYFFSWSELGYQPYSWLYGGMALQQTHAFATSGKFEPGCMLGISGKNWSVPIYVFNQPGGNTHFVMGINWDWQTTRKNSKPNSLATTNNDKFK